MASKKPKATTKSAKAADKKSQKPKTVAAEKTAKDVSAEAPKNIKTEAKPAEKACVAGACEKFTFKGFFAKKYPENESILSVFKCPKFYGALLAEFVGVLLLTLVMFSLSLMGLANIAMYAFGVIAITIAVFAFSGANLNPLITVGMMASRRMSVIRGVMYIIAQILGAWVGWLIFNGFFLAGGDNAYSMVAMSEIAEDGFWPVAFVEFLGAIIIAFCFVRALAYKRSVFSFAGIVAGGISIACLIGYVVSAAYLGLSGNFIFNPAVALMMQIFPTAGETFGEVLGGICQALSAYALVPMIGGVIGFYLADFMCKLTGEKLAE